MNVKSSRKYLLDYIGMLLKASLERLMPALFDIFEFDMAKSCIFVAVMELLGIIDELNDETKTNAPSWSVARSWFGSCCYIAANGTVPAVSLTPDIEPFVICEFSILEMFQTPLETLATPYTYPSLSKLYRDTDYILSFVRTMLVILSKLTDRILSSVTQDAYNRSVVIYYTGANNPPEPISIPSGNESLSMVHKVYTAWLEMCPRESCTTMLWPTNGLLAANMHLVSRLMPKSFMNAS